MQRLRSFFWLFLFCLPISGIASTDAARDRYVEAQLVLEKASVQPGETVWIGLRLNHDDKWHTYWKASATGYATSLINWDLPDGFEVGEILWPAPQPYYFEGYIEYVYENEVILPLELTIPADAVPGETYRISVTADWLMCEKTCIPGRVDLNLDVPVTAESGNLDSRWQALFDDARRLQPSPAPEGQVKAWRQGNQVVLEVPAPQNPDSLYFFDEQVFLVAQMEMNIRPQDDGKVQLLFEVDAAGVGSAERLVGDLYTEGGWESGSEVWKIDLSLGEAPLAPVETPAFIWILVIAFLGGLILNLMPCVFPVLGIKIMGFVNQAGSDRKKVISHGLVFTAGVMASFWLLAALLILLRSGGQELGWGFQLQSPGFVYLLAVFLFLFGLNMSGLFEVGQSAVGVGSNLTAKSGFPGSFFSGVLATVVATPCAAPFLAPALGVALALPAFSSMVVFTAIAAGLAFPYLFLSAFPSLIKMLPKPGAWMESFKQLMSFLLYGTVGYLIWVLVGQLTEPAGYSAFSTLLVFFSLVVIAIAAWAYGRWGAFYREQKVRYTAYAASAAILIGGVYMGYPQFAYSLEDGETPITWQSWEPGKAEALAEEGKIVYVDFTARWCVTCQTNKAAVFSSSEVRNWIRDNEVVLLIADWTNQDSRITQALAVHGRSAVPFNLVYGPEADEPEVLPELLTPGIVMNSFRRVTGTQP
jgi:thiol:disulfide interchange protein DsbD